MTKNLVFGTLLSILIFFAISFITVLFHLNSPLNRFDFYEMKIGFPFCYYKDFWVSGSSIPNYVWNVKNLILDCSLTWIVVVILFFVAKRERPSSVETEFDLSKILMLEDEGEAIMALDHLLFVKSKYGERVDLLNEEERVVLFIEMLEAQVNNGGFYQYFFNSSGNYVYETLKSLKRINAHTTTNLLQRAINIFPVSPVPKDQKVRRETMVELDDSFSEELNKLDDEYYQYSENLAKLLIEFVRKNKDKFQ